MFSCLVSMFVATVIGQSPDQAAWLKSVPAEVAVIARVKALETARDDLMKMLEAMSGNAAALARPQIEQGLAMMEAQTGKPSLQHPFFLLMNLPKDGPIPGWAVIVEAEDYPGVIKAITKKDDLKLDGKGGVDSFDGPDGQTMFSTKGKGFVAFGADEALVKSIAKPAASLDEKLATDVKQALLGGDLGVYVNVAAVQAQYSEQIEQGKQLFMGVLDQQGAAQMDEKTLATVKSLYGGIFDSIRAGDALAFNLNFAAEGLTLGGLVTVKGDSAAAKGLAAAKTGSAEGLGRLPASAMAFTYTNASPEGLKAMLKLVSPDGKPDPDAEKAMTLQIEAGALEGYSAIGDGAGGFSGMAALGFSTPKDPAKAVEATLFATKNAKSSGQAAFKSVDVTPKAETYKGFALNRMTITLDLEKMTPANAPGGPESMKKLMGGDTITSWIGTDGKTVINVGGKTFDEAKARIDAFLSGEGSIGKTPAFTALRGNLPKQVSTLVLVNAQGLVRMAAQTAAAMMGRDFVVPSDMPKEPALFGGSITNSPKGFQFQFIVPSNVGPVIEKGVVPMLEGIDGGAR